MYTYIEPVIEMKKTTKTKLVKLSVSFFKEGKVYIAYCFALDLSTSGNSIKEAKKHFTEAVDLFFEEITKNGTIEEVLLDLGWAKINNKFKPPTAISHEEKLIPVSV